MKTGGSAFPVLEKDIDYEGKPFLYCESEGMSLRDYFAGQALNQATKAAWTEYGQGEFLKEGQEDLDQEQKDLHEWKKIFTRAAEIAYITADAMLAEREKENA
jgi:hypothetical protein